MKITELMIGDWVKCPTFGNYQRVTAIDGLDNEVETTSDLYDAEEVSPIRLTPEILEQNGFGYIEADKISGITHYYLGERQFCSNMNLHVGSNDKGDYWLNYISFSVYAIRNVHELQHALRICGIEKEILL